MKTTAIKQMTAEHRHIETVIKSLEGAAAALEDRQRLDVEKLRKVAEFLRVYADRRHHQREEVLFFPVLVKRGVPGQGCPLGGLNHEHEKSRALLAALEERIAFYEQERPGADQVLQQALREIVKLYQHHLWMEDAMVFPLAEKVISEDDDRELLGKFADLDRAIGPGVIARLEQFAGGLSLRAEPIPAA
ncbi:MAG: hemerythrin domain-containing protein [Verrucomicrobiota bacterium]|nr:hemerythrin domain-containing protein [Verrucomicrobiota bacterium]